MACGAEYRADTTSSWTPGKYRAPTNTSGAEGSFAAMASSLAASSALASSLARAADFEPCPYAVWAMDQTNIAARHVRTRAHINPLRPLELSSCCGCSITRRVPGARSMGVRRLDEQRVFV